MICKELKVLMPDEPITHINKVIWQFKINYLKLPYNLNICLNQTLKGNLPYTKIYHTLKGNLP